METLEQIYGGRIEDLPGLRKKRKVAAMLWYVKGDAAAKDGAEVDGGGGAPKLGGARKTKQRARREKKEMTLWSIYKDKGYVRQARKSRGRKFGNGAVASIVADSLMKRRRHGGSTKKMLKSEVFY